MADIRMQMEFRKDIDAPLLVQPSVTLLKEGDSEANLILIRLYSGKEEADVSGSAVSGYLLRADGARVPLTGSAIGNTVTVTLNEHCYLVPGPYGAFVRLVSGGIKRTILEIAGEVKSEGDGPVVDAGEKLITLDDIIAQMNKMQQVTEETENAADTASTAASAANTAAGTANTAAGKANAATENANTATSNANNAASRANTAAATIENMTVSSEDVGPETSASAAISTADGKKNIHFKLRQGQKGDTGATPDITFNVVTGAPGTQVEIQQSGTPENPVVTLTIPRGDTGAVEGIDYYEGNPAALGIASPGTANGLARGDHVHPMPSAADVGALASSYKSDVDSLIRRWNVNTNANVCANVDNPVQTGFFHCDTATAGTKPSTHGELLHITEDPKWSEHQLFFTSGDQIWHRRRNNNGTANSAVWSAWKRIMPVQDIYPAGSIYLSVNSTSPASLFGGTWEQIKGRFLLACGDNGDGWNYSAGSTGGEPTHTLTVNEMPSHSHGFNGVAGDLVAAGNSFYPVQYVAGENHSAYINATGGSAAHNNMPPYLVVYMWKRVS